MSNQLMQSEEFYAEATRYLDSTDFVALKDYREAGKMRLAPSTTAGMFELFLNGTSLREIHRLNKAFPFGAILWSYVEEKWEDKKVKFIDELHDATRQKLVKATMDTASLLSDMLSAAYLQHGSKLKKYMQTGNPEDLGDAMTVDSITTLVRAIDGLQKITGTDKTVKVKNETVFSGTLTVANGGHSPQMSGEEAAKFLADVSGRSKP